MNLKVKLELLVFSVFYAFIRLFVCVIYVFFFVAIFILHVFYLYV